MMRNGWIIVVSLSVATDLKPFYSTFHVSLRSLLCNFLWQLISNLSTQHFMFPKPLTLEGLGHDLERDESIRARALETRGLLKWPCPDKAGLISMQTMADNADVLMHVVRKWVPQLTDKLKTVNVHLVEQEAR